MTRQIDYRKNLEEGKQFFIRRESYKRTYQLLAIKELNRVYQMKMDNVLIPDCYVFLMSNSFIAVHTASGIAIMGEPVPFYEILFIH